MRIYLDACCINRPFDDQIQDRIRLESEAVLLVLGHCAEGRWQWVSDDRMLRLAKRFAKRLSVRVNNPLNWLSEEQNR